MTSSQRIDEVVPLPPGLPGELRHRRVTVDGTTLHVVEAGPDDAPAVMLLHGFPEFWWGWRRQMGPLATAGFRVVVPDGRGYNLSDKPLGASHYRLRRLVADVLGLADALGLDSFRLVGHDWGGVVAFAAAALHPRRIARLAVLNAPHPDTWARAALRHPSQAMRSLYVGLFQCPVLPEALLSAHDFAAMRRALLGSSRPGTFSSRDLARYAATWAEPGALTGMLNWYRGLRHADRTPLPRIDPETLLVWGRGDRFLEAHLAEAAIQLCRSGRILYRDASHWVHQEDADAVNTALLGFLGEP